MDLSRLVLNDHDRREIANTVIEIPQDELRDHIADLLAALTKAFYASSRLAATGAPREANLVAITATAINAEYVRINEEREAFKTIRRIEDIQTQENP